MNCPCLGQYNEISLIIYFLFEIVFHQIDVSSKKQTGLLLALKTSPQIKYQKSG